MSGYVTMNGYQATEARISIPRVGPWTADLALVTTDAVQSGPASITVVASAGGTPVAFTGTIVRGDQFNGLLRVRVVGGGAGFGNALPAQGYYQVPLKIVLQDALALAGESLSATAAAGVLGQVLPAWTRAQGPAGAVVQALAELAGASWRVLQDGTLWMGTESWAASSATYVLLEKRPELGQWDVFMDPPSLLPGQTLAGGNVTYVEHYFAGEKLRTQVIFEDTQLDVVDRAKGGFRRLLNQLFGRRLDYLAAYPATAVSQNGDGSLEIVFDNTRFGQLNKVPIRWGVPGLSANVAPGARVWVQWAEGNPSRPYCTLWESASVSSWNLSVAPGGTLNLLVGAGGTANLATGAGATVNVGGAASTSINLGAALQLVARSLDPLIGTAGPFPLAGTVGVPTTNTNVKA